MDFPPKSGISLWLPGSVHLNFVLAGITFNEPSHSGHLLNELNIDVRFMEKRDTQQDNVTAAYPATGSLSIKVSNYQMNFLHTINCNLCPCKPMATAISWCGHFGLMNEQAGKKFPGVNVIFLFHFHGCCPSNLSVKCSRFCHEPDSHTT